MEPLNRDVLLDLMKEVLSDVGDINEFLGLTKYTTYCSYISKMLFYNILNCNVLISNDTLSVFMYILRNTKCVENGERLRIELFDDCYSDGDVICDVLLKIIGENTQKIYLGSDGSIDSLFKPKVAPNPKLNVIFAALKNNKRLQTLIFGSYATNGDLINTMNNVILTNITHIRGAFKHFKYISKYNLKLKNVELDLDFFGWNNDFANFFRLPGIQCYDTLTIYFSQGISFGFIPFGVKEISSNFEDVKKIRFSMEFDYTIPMEQILEIFKLCNLFPKLESLNIRCSWNCGICILHLIKHFEQFFASNPTKLITNIEVLKEEGHCDDNEINEIAFQYKCCQYKEDDQKFLNVKVPLADNVSLNMKAKVSGSNSKDVSSDDDDYYGYDSSD